MKTLVILILGLFSFVKLEAQEEKGLYVAGTVITPSRASGDSSCIARGQSSADSIAHIAIPNIGTEGTFLGNTCYPPDKIFFVLKSFFPAITHDQVIKKANIFLFQEIRVNKFITLLLTILFLWFPIFSIFGLSFYIDKQNLDAPLFTFYLFLMLGVLLMFFVGKYFGLQGAILAPIFAAAVTFGCLKIYHCKEWKFYKTIFITSFLMNLFVGVEMGFLSPVGQYVEIAERMIWGYFYVLCASCVLARTFILLKNITESKRLLE